jgi:hypothetical protein
MSLAFSAVAPASGETAADAAKLTAQPLRGISVAGAEFEVPAFDVADSYAYLASRHYTVVRLPFLWERVQPTLGEPLDAAALASISGAVQNAASAGMSVILDIHNYARYDGVAYGESGSFTQAEFADLWTRLSTVFRDDPAVVGYGLMNEPHDLPAVSGVSGKERWQQAQQAALTAIRATGDVTCVLVSGYSWSSMAGWDVGQPPYITDPANNFRWEAHDYWDLDSSGTYATSYATVNAAAANVGYPDLKGDALRTRVYSVLEQWLNWLDTYDQKGYIGEFGWPSAENANSPEDAAAWDSLADMYLDRVNQTPDDQLWTTAWAAGAAWVPDYELLYYRSTAGVITTPLSNAATLEANARELNPVAPPAPAPPVVPGDTGGSTETPPAVIPTDTVTTSTTTSTTVVKKPASTIKVTVKKRGAHPRLTIRVKSKGKVSGVVSVSVGKRVLVKSVKLRKGVAVVTIKAKLASRTHKLVVRYAGTSKVAASSTKVKVRVAR